MKHIILSIIFLFLFCINCFAINPALLFIATDGGCAHYDCSGTGALLWECNSTTVGDSNFCPYGCSDTATTMTANDEATITSGSAVYDDTLGGGSAGVDFHSFNPQDISMTACTMFMRVVVTTWVTGVEFYAFRIDAEPGNDQTYVSMYGADDVFMRYEGDNSPVTINSTDDSLGAGEYIIRARWRTGASNPSMDVYVYNTSMVEQASATTDDDLTVINPVPSGDEGTVGNEDSASGSNFSVKYIRFYNEWRDTDPNV